MTFLGLGSEEGGLHVDIVSIRELTSAQQSPLSKLHFPFTIFNILLPQAYNQQYDKAKSRSLP